MSLAVVSRTALLTAVGWAALAGAAAAQSAPRAAELDEVIVTGMPFGVTDRASLLAVEVLDEEDLAVAPASTLAVSSGSTMKQLARLIELKIPDPCSPVGATTHSPAS